MPFLRLETATPTETDLIIQKQAKEIEDLKKKFKDLEDSIILKADLSKPITDEEKRIATQYVEYVLHGEGKAKMLDFYEGFKAFMKEKEKNNAKKGESNESK